MFYFSFASRNFKLEFEAQFPELFVQNHVTRKSDDEVKAFELGALGRVGEIMTVSATKMLIK